MTCRPADAPGCQCLNARYCQECQVPAFNHEGFRAYFRTHINTVDPAALISMPLLSEYIADSRYADPLQRALVDVSSLTHDDIDMLLGIPELQALAAAYEATDPDPDPGPVCTECRSFTLLYQGECITAAACYAMGNTVNGSSSVYAIRYGWPFSSDTSHGTAVDSF